MGTIRRLPPEVYLKIAAGEVVERPLSVVKELVENSVDAGADLIEIELARGGKELILVRDNGCGFPEAEMETAFLPHSTSKISELEDLDTIRTLGFRGEALASILAVADLRVISCDNSSGQGLSIRFREGNPVEKKIAAHPRGTLIEVRELFGNFPVRLKFLKSDRHETRLISSFLEQFFLFRPGIRVKLSSDKRRLFDHQAVSGIRERVYQFFGKEAARGLLEVAAQSDGWMVRGLLSPINSGSAGRELQYFSVNGRLVRDRALFGSANAILREFYEKGSKPEFFLEIDTPPGEVDVNVHPQKLEIRFRNGGQLYLFLRHALLDALGVRGSAEPGFQRRQHSEGLSEFLPAGKTPEPEIESLPRALDFGVSPGKPDFTLLGQYRNSYLVAERNGMLLVVDQHNAHENAIYHRLREKRASRGIKSVRTLIPIVVQLSVAELNQLENRLSDFADLGFEVELFSSDTVSIKAYPDFLTVGTARGIFLEIMKMEYEGIESLWQKTIATVACKSAVKVNTPLARAEQEQILQELFALENPNLCPHRRPVFLEIGLAEIEKKLRRS